MSVAEFPSAQSHAQFERTPPQDVAAEQSVLGGMLLSKDAIADVVEVVRGHDFYRPAHELVYETVLDLYGRGEPADAVTVSAELQKRGELTRVGGAPYLHTLISSVPTAANAGYYARIVRETAVLRRLIEAGTKIVQMGFAGDGDADDVVDAAQAEVYAVTDRRTSEDYLPLSAIMEGTLDEIEAIGSRGGEMVGVPTGFADFDELTNGLHPGQMIVVAARPAVGKALALDTLLPTPDGWTTMSEVSVGDQLLGADGRPTTVVAATPVMLDRCCYEVVFSDGSTIVADAEHGWLTDTRASRPSVKTTEQIAGSMHRDGSKIGRRHRVRNAAALALPDVDLPIAPYALGAWLGEGCIRAGRFTSSDPEIAMYLGIEVAEVRAEDRLQDLRVLGEKHIPASYLRASEAQRRELLAGLLDTDGTVTAGGSVQFAVTSQRLAMDTRELIVSLGYRCGLSTKRVKGRRESSSTAYILTFSTNDDVFRLECKRLVHKERRSGRDAKIGSRYIVDVRHVASVPVRCVQVDNAEHLYLAGQAMVPTHNSTLGLDIARSAAIKHQLTTCVFSLEMSRNEITMRLLSAEARVSLHHMRTGKLTDDDWTRLARRMGEVSNAPLFIDDSPNMSMMEIRAKCRRLKQRHDLKLVVVDYLQLMTSGKRVESRQQEVSEFSRALKLLAKELEVPVIAISQLNRSSEQRTDKKPQMSDLRESGCLPASTRIMRADTGAEATLGDLMAAGATDIPVWSLDESLRYRPRTMTSVFSSGRKEVFTLTLASGKTVQATANHPFLTYDGWCPLGRLAPGARVAVPRHLPGPLDSSDDWCDADVAALASADLLPDDVFALPKRQIALLLWNLWRDRGVVDADRTGHGVIALRPGDRRIAEAVSRLLLRFGISSVLRPASLDIAETDDQRRFLQEIGFPGPEAARMLRRVLVETQSRGARVARDDDVWARVERLFDHDPARVSAGNVAVLDHARPVLSDLAVTLSESDLEIAATNDVLWDDVVSIESVGVQEVFDATVLGTHNFVADGIAVHNSIEQDADMVVLLHREELYERESPRAGEADFIVAKHRNGPTATITVAFQGHYSRFVDMAQS
ncbi:MAG: replicative DNA helicase [Sporichthyaceae bacterium]